MGRSTRNKHRGGGSGGEHRPPDSGRPPAWTHPRMLGAGEDPLAWSVPLFRLGGLAVRGHVFALVWLLAELVAWVPQQNLGLIHVLAATSGIIVIAAVREVCRAALSRLLGAEVDTVVIWPLGGLSGTPQGAIARPILAETGGLMAGLLLVPVLGGLALWSGVEWSGLLLEPLSPRVEAAKLSSMAQVWAWWAFYGNGVMVLANALLPMSPMDAGRVVRSWERVRALQGPGSYAGGGLLAPEVGIRSLRLGLFTGLATFIVGASAGETRLMALGAFGAFATYLEYRRAEFVRAGGAVTIEPEEVAAFRPVGEPEPAETPPAPQPPRAREPALDEVLSKISASGLASLDESEREVLRRETARRRQR